MGGARLRVRRLTPSSTAPGRLRAALRHGIASHNPFNRRFAALDPKAFLDGFLRWTQSLRQAVPQEVVALDGKALGRALHADQSVKYVVSAWAGSNGLVLGQLKVADKRHEITALPELLRGGESGDAAPTGVELVETRENQKVRHPGQTTQRRL